MSDPHFLYDNGNLYDALKKKNRMVFACKQEDRVMGLFVWSVPEEERYAEMLVGFVQTKTAMYEMLDFMEKKFPGFQADFVINPQNEIIRRVLNEKKAAFDAEQQRMLHSGEGQFADNGRTEAYSPKWKEKYCSIHSTDAKTSAEQYSAKRYELSPSARKSLDDKIDSALSKKKLIIRKMYEIRIKDPERLKSITEEKTVSASDYSRIFLKKEHKKQLNKAKAERKRAERIEKKMEENTGFGEFKYIPLRDKTPAEKYPDAVFSILEHWILPRAL